MFVVLKVERDYQKDWSHFTAKFSDFPHHLLLFKTENKYIASFIYYTRYI